MHDFSLISGLPADETKVSVQELKMLPKGTTEKFLTVKAGGIALTNCKTEEALTKRTTEVLTKSTTEKAVPISTTKESLTNCKTDLAVKNSIKKVALTNSTEEKALTNGRKEVLLTKSTLEEAVKNGAKVLADAHNASEGVDTDIEAKKALSKSAKETNSTTEEALTNSATEEAFTNSATEKQLTNSTTKKAFTNSAKEVELTLKTSDGITGPGIKQDIENELQNGQEILNDSTNGNGKLVLESHEELTNGVVNVTELMNGSSPQIIDSNVTNGNNKYESKTSRKLKMEDSAYDEEDLILPKAKEVKKLGEQIDMNKREGMFTDDETETAVEKGKNFKTVGAEKPTEFFIILPNSHHIGETTQQRAEDLNLSKSFNHKQTNNSTFLAVQECIYSL